MGQKQVIQRVWLSNKMLYCHGTLRERESKREIERERESFTLAVIESEFVIGRFYLRARCFCFGMVSYDDGRLLSALRQEDE